MINITVLDMELDSRLSEMPKPKYVCTDSWNIPVVGQEDYDALRAHAESLQAQRDKLAEALNSIREYWNQDRNDKAMFDACWYAIDTADTVLKECGK